MKILIGVGGGIDSTYLLWEYLFFTPFQVIAFFVDMSKVEYDDPNAKKGFWKASARAEYRAVLNIRQWFIDHKRDYEFRVVKVDTATDARAPVVVREGALICSNDVTIDKFIFGRSPEQLCQGGLKNTPYYKKVWADNAPGHVVMEWPLVEKRIGRPHSIRDLPPDLLALTISCHEPTLVDGKPTKCNECPKCVTTNKALEMHKAGIDPDIALDFLLRKLGAEPYIGSSTIDRRYQSARNTDSLKFLRSPDIEE